MRKFAQDDVFQSRLSTGLRMSWISCAHGVFGARSTAFTHTQRISGFTVIDLGVNVPPEKFVDAINENEPDIVGFSAFLTTTMPMFKANINALQKAGVRDEVIVMVGGAPVTQEYADAVGADGYSADASSAVKKAKQLIEQRRSAVPA